MAEKGDEKSGNWTVAGRPNHQNPYPTDVTDRPFSFMLTGGNAVDSRAAPHLLTGLKGTRYLLADKGYDANSLRTHSAV